ncbi:hypothetical protein FOMPIDRAFT_114526 [Fomitopsis schrenkii]|uniref:Uncharacterized protein n=1 Tax=Fomitopsis schrenkii TaxID=2126942 RepID=S8DZ38_FOMSC|nr:hypothetical protein FOMPIDRAFT_114526 [Fomitopsis schrenkii]
MYLGCGALFSNVLPSTSAFPYYGITDAHLTRTPIPVLSKQRFPYDGAPSSPVAQYNTKHTHLHIWFPGGGTHSNPPPSPPTAPRVTSTSTTLAPAQTTSPSPASSDPPDASRPAISHISSTLGPNTTPTAAPWPSSVPQSTPPDGSKPVSGTDSAITSDGRQSSGWLSGSLSYS